MSGVAVPNGQWEDELVEYGKDSIIGPIANPPARTGLKHDRCVALEPSHRDSYQCVSLPDDPDGNFAARA